MTNTTDLIQQITANLTQLTQAQESLHRDALKSANPAETQSQVIAELIAQMQLALSKANARLESEHIEAGRQERQLRLNAGLAELEAMATAINGLSEQLESALLLFLAKVQEVEPDLKASQSKSNGWPSTHLCSGSALVPTIRRDRQGMFVVNVRDPVATALRRQAEALRDQERQRRDQQRDLDQRERVKAEWKRRRDAKLAELAGAQRQLTAYEDCPSPPRRNGLLAVVEQLEKELHEIDAQRPNPC